RCPAWWRRRAPPRAAPRLASPAFPTRRSSDLSRLRNQNNILHSIRENYISHTTTTQYKLFVRENGTHTYRTGSLINNTTYSVNLDRKSTRLNSSHASTSYAVFCLKKETRHREL